MATGTVYNFPMLITCFSSSSYKNPQPSLFLRFNPPSIRASRSRFCIAPILARKLPRRVLRVHGLLDDDDDDSVTAPPSESHNSEPVASIDLNLPRRSLLVQFTCDLCGERTKRLVNRLAYERGTVFVQCAGCQQHHKLVDNLGLITEYDFREKTKTDSEVDQI
ncbi:Zim17-type zinc finger protein [Trifolium repens]|nr:Zim17-type zinc finger protein [Trifolium repens]